MRLGSLFVIGTEREYKLTKSNSGRTARALLLLLSLVVLIIAFSGCTTAGSGDVYDKDVLWENVTRGDTCEHDTVWEYLDEWQFPTFSKTKLSAIEKTFGKRYYLPLPTAAEHARQAAEIFLEEFYDKTDLTSTEAVTDALARSYVLALGDDYSFYRTKEEYEAYSSTLSGSFVGIGITVIKGGEKNGIPVISVMKGGGAKEAGILEGDLIIGVGGVPYSELGYDAAIAAIGGDEGTTVEITVLREGTVHRLTVERRKITEETVSYYITDDGIGYIEITSFKSNTAEQFFLAVDYMEENGARAVVYDLRSNGGGYLSAVSRMLDYISPDGVTLVSFSNGYGKANVADDGHELLLPSVVITNGGTASAGELFTAGVRDPADMGYFEATTVGTTTFGKGVMQSTYRLTDGSALTVTVAYYNPPSNENYHGTGITPDVIIEAAKGSDPQLEGALSEAHKIIN